MSVYNVPRNGITLEKFKDICPSLVQQKLSGACKKDASSKKHEDKEHPTDLERNATFHLEPFICFLNRPSDREIVKIDSLLRLWKKTTSLHSSHFVEIVMIAFCCYINAEKKR